MVKLNLDTIFRGALTIVIGSIGFILALFLLNSGFATTLLEFTGLGIVGISIATYIICTLVFLFLGFIVSPFIIYFMKDLMKFLELRLSTIPTADLFGGIIGLIIGLIIASLLGSLFNELPFIGSYIQLFLSVVLGVVGVRIGIKKRQDIDISGIIKKATINTKKKQSTTIDEQAMIDAANADDSRSEETLADIMSFVANARAYSQGGVPAKPKILDTSVIIDGRIEDIYATGFVEGVLIVPKFVLVELQHISDSADALKRAKGRRGLDILNAMQRHFGEALQITDTDYPDIADTDDKLVMLAQELGGVILTNDFNLNKVSELQGIKCLNINELVNSLRQVLISGEELVVLLLKEGKERTQAIGYLDDGTMIVVENSRKYLGKKIYAVVTSILQTSAGRMIFAKPKFNDKRTVVEKDD